MAMLDRRLAGGIGPRVKFEIDHDEARFQECSTADKESPINWKDNLEGV
jgi:hypothetical protein